MRILYILLDEEVTFRWTWYDKNMVAFTLPGNVPIYAYSLMMALGCLVGLYWVSRQEFEQEAARSVQAGLWTLLGALVGGRAAYVIAHWGYFQLHPLETVQIYLGGLAWPGALGGSLLALGVYATLKHLPLGNTADALMPLLLVLSLCAWLGCWLDGCAYGRTSSGLLALPAPDEWGVVDWRWPVQPLGALLTVWWFRFLERNQKRLKPRPGAYACLGFLGVTAILFSLSFQRTDPSLLYRGLRLETWAAAIFSLLFLLALIYLGLRKRKRYRP